MAILAIGASQELDRFSLGQYDAVLLGNVQSIGLIRYGHVLLILDRVTQKRVFAIAAEENMLAKTKIGGGSHFICGYAGAEHLNYGASDDYANRDKFLNKAIELAQSHLNISAAPLRSAPLSAPASAPMMFSKPTVASSQRVPQDVAIAGMLLSLAGVALLLFLEARFFLRLGNSRFAEMVIEFTTTYFFFFNNFGPAIAYGLFAIGCQLTANSSGMLRWAKYWSLAALAISLTPLLGFYYFPIRSMALFMFGLFCHAHFLMELARSRGWGFRSGKALQLVYGWGLLALFQVYVGLSGEGVLLWLEALTMLGLVIWCGFQLGCTLRK